MARVPKDTLDNSYARLVLSDFSLGLNTYKGALALGSNESPDMLNVIPFPGRLQYRGGWDIHSTIPLNPDHVTNFFDTNGTKHFITWAGGNIYENVNSSPTLLLSNVYVPGQLVGSVVLNGVLYWSTATVALQFYNPVTSTSGDVVQTGPSLVPMSPYIFLYTQSIVALQVDFGTGVQENVFSWSGINDPGYWDAAQSQAVGPRNGGSLVFGVVMGIANIGVAPFRSFIVGRDDEGIYGYSGALGTLQEFLVNCPTGCIDGASAQYLPSAGKLGTVVFLGKDAQIWATDGISAEPISIPVLPTLAADVQNAIVADGLSVRFFSGYNERYQYYFVCVNGKQYVYKWDLKAWSLFSGWPVGPVMTAPNSNSLPSLFVASKSTYSGNYVLAEIALDQTKDNGSIPSVYYKTPYLHMGDPNMFKEFHWIVPFFLQTGSKYTVGGTSLPRPDGTFYTTSTLTFTTQQSAGTVSNPFILDTSILDGTDVLGSAVVSAIGTGTPQVNKGRLSCPITGTGMLKGVSGLNQVLMGKAAQFTISLSSSSSVCDFELIGLQTLFLERGYDRDGGSSFNVEGGINSSFDIFAPVPNQ